MNPIRSAALVVGALVWASSALAETRPVAAQHLAAFYGISGPHRESDDCFNEEFGAANELCFQRTDDSLWWCPEDEALCNNIFETPPDTEGWVQVAGGGGGGNGFGTIGNAVADAAADTLTVTDSTTIDFTTTDGPEDLTAALIQNAGTDVLADLEEEAHCSEHDSADVDCSGETIILAADSVDDSNLNISKTINVTFRFPSLDDNILVKLEMNSTDSATPVSWDCTATGSTTPSSFVIAVSECTTGGASCAAIGASVTLTALETNAQDTSFTDSSLANDAWLSFSPTSFTTSPDFAHCRLVYTY